MANHKALIRRALKLYGGSQTKLAEAMGCTQQQVWFLLERSKGVSAEMALAVERATGGKVTRKELRPDLFGTEPEQAA
jgi:DNA-binding transcriptional regulator YdaS (Cro superfamily)